MLDAALRQKLCPKCTSLKLVGEFSRNKRMADGLGRWCRACCAASHSSWYENIEVRKRVRARAAEWYASNKGRAQRRAAEYRRSSLDLGPRKAAGRYQQLAANPKLEWAKQAVRNARQRARAKGLEFDLDAEFVVAMAGDTCPVLGIRLAYPDGDRRIMGGQGDSASLDRLDNAQGYVRGNVAVISRRANAIKTDANITEVRAVLIWMEKLIDYGVRGTIYVPSGGD